MDLRVFADSLGKKNQQTNTNHGLVLSLSFSPSGNRIKHRSYNNKRFYNFIKGKGDSFSFSEDSCLKVREVTQSKMMFSFSWVYFLKESK